MEADSILLRVAGIGVFSASSKERRGVLVIEDGIEPPAGPLPHKPLAVLDAEEDTVSEVPAEEGVCIRNKTSK